MPTARELLEQADALMRRNRAAAVDDIPVLTDSVPPLTESRLARRAPQVEARPQPARGSPDAIPTLTERVAPDLAEAADSMAHEGEPSDWLDLDGGEPSITGEAPDSIAIVPPVAIERPVDEALLASAEHEEIELTTPVEDDFDAEVGVRAPETAERDAPPVQPPPPLSEPPAVVTATALTAMLGLAAATDVPVSLRAPEPVAEPVPEPVAQPVPEPVAEAEPEPEPELAEPPLAAAEAAAPVSPEAPPPPVVPDALPMHVVPEPPPPPVVPAPAPAIAAIDDQARWDAMAEEIRMQVLQRIDLFTDTGLREQLGRRLQPIVDRASADLVATINLHVGELLRAYVAEAIEREIESWRKNN
ncbi:MAG: hypothetical protein U1F15_13320 [Burkholderiales bacterium]